MLGEDLETWAKSLEVWSWETHHVWCMSSYPVWSPTCQAHAPVSAILLWGRRGRVAVGPAGAPPARGTLRRGELPGELWHRETGPQVGPHTGQ